ncbi:hypothetical protein BHE74_00051755 [Ensete ventricosum]|nr:hypothetical protein BHE74_00051755 [Ensete ventricosum]RZS11198.1 hypothetical protein BHM03_00042506 [Ensete ventricosum]
MNLLGMKKVVAARAPRPEMSRPTAEPNAEKPMSVEVGPPLKRLKKSGDSPAPAPKLKLASGERSNQKEKGVTHPRSMRDLY